MVYICYARKDKSVVQEICQSLTRMGVKVFVDYEQLAGGDYARELTELIESAETILFFYSENAENSTWAKREVEFALSKNKRVIPVLLTEVADSGWYQYHLGKTQCVILGQEEPESFAKHIASILHLEEAKGKSESRSPLSEPRRKAKCEESPKSSRRRSVVVMAIIAVIIVIVGLFTILMRKTPSLPEPECGQPDYLPAPNVNEYYEEMIWQKDSCTPCAYKEPAIVCNDNTICEDTVAAMEIRVDTVYYELEEGDYGDTTEYNNSIHYMWLYILIAFSVGSGLMFVLLRKKKSKRENVKLSSNISSKVSIDGTVIKEIVPREIYATHLDKGEYLIDFEDKSDKKRHQTFNHIVRSNECKVVFANFPDEEIQGGKTIKCFIAGSKTLQSERDALRAVTCVMYNKWASKNFRILSYTFEDFERAAVVGGHQKQYNDFIMKEADWALFIIDGNVGGITVEEYRKAMNAYKQNGKPKILALAKTGSEDNAEVAAIKSEINKEHQYWTDYSDISSLKLIFESTLNWELIGLFQK